MKEHVLSPADTALPGTDTADADPPASGGTGWLSSSSSSSRGDRSAQLRRLSRSVLLEETDDPQFAGIAAKAICAVVVALLLWAAFATVPEVARGTGRVEPFGFERVVQHASGGLVATVHVTTGDHVDAGQPLATLDDTLLREDMERALVRVRTLAAESEILRAYVENRAPDFSVYGGANSFAVREARATLSAMLKARDDRLGVAERQVAQRRQELQVLRTDLGNAEEQAVLMRGLRERRQQLFDKGVSTYDRLLQAEREVETIEGTIRSLKDRIRQAEYALEEFSVRLVSVDTEDQSSAMQRLQDLHQRLSDALAIRTGIETQLNQLVITAPVAGIVKAGDGLTPGEVLGAGTTAFEIVPDEEPLVARVQISPRDVARIAVGQPTQIRVDAYQDVRYGPVPGRVEKISAGSFVGDDGSAFFLAEVSLDRNHVGTQPGVNPIGVGMTVSVDIINGERTFLQYLLKPVHLALEGAFRES